MKLTDHKKLARSIPPRYVATMEQQRFTEKQGQYLAFIYAYSKVNRRPPSEADIQSYFRVTPPTVHGMVLKLEALGLITRAPGQARSIQVTVPRSELPDLE